MWPPWAKLAQNSIFGYLGSLKAEFSRESGSKKEKDLPVAMDCTTLALVDAVQSNPASLLAENQECEVEPKDCHVRVASRREGTFSSAPIAKNEFCLSSAMPAAGVAIANQTPGLVEQSYSATLSGENQVLGVEIKPVDEGESSAAPVPNPEK
ncbi:hypothetical protein H6G97_37820 [Nostoc flagelliforme FACHB-838]|uniref:Uncharacterized protein n=1 Tax=Nostoc flagelliforme FACHB-838 TaxID=2692904 RepID=A0ABR8E0Z3_9NOSO|nr:hypothetical protein [Nostoc flagelliforme]MBD2534890.1 hypothetical protein [Nostoc flagelliforme FACHB-838]